MNRNEIKCWIIEVTFSADHITILYELNKMESKVKNHARLCCFKASPSVFLFIEEVFDKFAGSHWNIVLVGTSSRDSR